jgi:hypothetical protein
MKMSTSPIIAATFYASDPFAGGEDVSAIKLCRPSFNSNRWQGLSTKTSAFSYRRCNPFAAKSAATLSNPLKMDERNTASLAIGQGAEPYASGWVGRANINKPIMNTPLIIGAICAGVGN